MKREDILKQAEELVNGDRAKNYGDALVNHQRIADGWNCIVRGAMDSHGYLTEGNVVLMMDWVKSSRLLHTIGHKDSWVDKCGYSSLGAEFMVKE